MWTARRGGECSLDCREIHSRGSTSKRERYLALSRGRLQVLKPAMHAPTTPSLD